MRWLRDLLRSRILARILGGYALIAAMLGFGLVVTDAQFNRLNAEFYGLLEQDVALVDGIERLREGLVTIQSSKRAYLLTGDREFLARHMSARESFPELIARVRREGGSSAQDRRELNQLDADIARYIELAAPELALRERVTRGEIPLEDVVSLVRSNNGAALAEQSQRALIAMHDRALRSVDQQRRVVLAASSLSRRVAVVVMVLSLLVALIYGSWVSRDLAQALTYLRNAIEAMARGERLTSPARVDEIGEVTRSFDAMADRLTVAEQDLVLKVEEQEATLGQLRETNDALAQAMRVKGDFLSTMSHELRTPLNAVIGLSALLLDSPQETLSPRARTSLETMRTSGEHLLGLLNDILDLAKAEAGRMTLSPTRVKIAPMIEVCLATVQPMTESRPVGMVFAPLDREVTVRADPQKVHQVLLNLLSNAAKFTDRGTVTVSATVEGPRVLVTVEDTGIGIAEEEMARLFEEFHQVARGDARRYAGTGLGLALSRKMARLMGGEITARSVLGEGSAFILSLPSGAQDDVLESEP